MKTRRPEFNYHKDALEFDPMYVNAIQRTLHWTTGETTTEALSIRITDSDQLDYVLFYLTWYGYDHYTRSKKANHTLRRVKECYIDESLSRLTFQRFRERRERARNLRRDKKDQFWCHSCISHFGKGALGYDFSIPYCVDCGADHTD